MLFCNYCSLVVLFIG